MAHDFKRFPELTNNQMRFYYFESPHKQIKDDFIARVIKVTDGDTIRVETDFRDFDFPVRFLDIAAPELKEEGGLESKEWLEEQLLGEEVRVEIEYENRVEKWGRLLGRIFRGGIDMNNMSLRLRHSILFDELI